MGVRAISANQHVAGRVRTILEAHSNSTSPWVLVSNELLVVTNNAAEPFAENAPQSDAAHWQLATSILAIAVWQVDNKQTIQAMIKKCDAFAWLGAVLD